MRRGILLCAVAFCLAAGTALHTFNIQETGGTRKTVAAGVEAIRAMLPYSS